MKAIINSVEIADYCDDRSTCVVNVKCRIKEENFHIQTIDGLHRGDLGCWVTTDDNGDDIDFDNERFEGFDFSLIIKEAEKCVQNQYKIENVENSNYILKVYQNVEKVEVCEVNDNYINRDMSSYQTEYKVIATFENVEEATNFARKLK